MTRRIARVLVSGLFAGLALACAAPRTNLGPCPTPRSAESTADCPWASVARALESRADPNAVKDELRALLPATYAAIADDARRSELLAAWGRSTNFDEAARGSIVSPFVLDALNDLARSGRRDGNVTHAGIAHTYGYLFSTLRTSFGYKRARWVQGDLEAGFGLARGTLGPAPPSGTLFSNVTYFLGAIAFRGDAPLRAALEENAGGVAEAVRGFDYGRLRPVRIEETIALAAHAREVVLRTDLVPFPSGVVLAASTHLLVYSVCDSADAGGRARLITAFPVARAFVDAAVDPAQFGDDRPIVTRYNAVVQGVTDAAALRGTRRAR